MGGYSGSPQLRNDDLPVADYLRKPCNLDPVNNFFGAECSFSGSTPDIDPLVSMTIIQPFIPSSSRRK